MSKYREMEKVFDSFEWLLRDRLEQLDWTIRCMFTEISTFGVKFAESKPYVQERFYDLVREVSSKGDIEYGEYQKRRPIRNGLDQIIKPARDARSHSGRR